MKKVYQKKDQFSNQSSLRIDYKGGSKTIIFENKKKNGNLIYESSDEEEQKGIESSRQFKEGRIIVLSSTPTKEEPQKDEGNTGGGSDLTVIDSVSTYQEAKDLLRAEPYLVAHQALGTPEKILAKAAELGITFPNLTAE